MFPGGPCTAPLCPSPPKETLYNHRERRKFDVYHDIATVFWSFRFRVSDLRAKMHFRFIFGYYILGVEPLRSGVSRRRRTHGYGSND